MAESTLYRTAAVGLILGALVVAISALLAPQGNDFKAVTASPLYYPTAVGGLLGGLAIIASWPATFLRQRAEAGALGLAAMLLVLLPGAAILVGFQLVDVLIWPWAASLPLSHSQVANGPASVAIFFPVATLVVAVGGVLFGVTVIRARVYSRRLGLGFMVLALVSLVLGFLSLPGVVGSLGELAYMLGLAWAGYELWLATRSPQPAATSMGAPAAQARSAS